MNETFAGRSRRSGRRRIRGPLAAAIGFVLPVVLRAEASAAQSQPPTYQHDIAPIVARHCTTCHRADGAAPFSLTRFDEVRARARLIVEVTTKRYMPPWKPSPGGGGPFVGERRLSDAEIATIAAWVAAGAPAGDAADADQSRADAPSASLAGQPDLIVTLPQPYDLTAGGADVFRNFVVPIPVREMKYVAAIEFRPEGSRALHHVNLRLDRSSSSRELDAADPLPGYEGPIGVNARYPDGYFLGWTPGQQPTRAAPGMAWRLAPDSDLVLQLHLRKTGKAERVQPSIAFYFTTVPPTRLPLAMRLGKQNIDIAPGATLVARDSYRLPVSVELHAIHPHAHYRARVIKAAASLPDGTIRPLIEIDDWDFNWQDIYRYTTPVMLPRGTVITSEFTYDNTAGNPRNPDSPPRRVRFGQNSSDEMGDLWLQVLPASDRERAELYEDFYPKTLAEDAAGYEMLLSADPDHPGYHSDLGLLLARLGQRARAIGHLQQAIALKPDFAAAHYNLATLYAAGGRLPEAEGAFRAALSVRPAHAETHNNLGAVLKAMGKLDEAIDHFKRAVDLDPNNTEAQTNLSIALKLKG